MFRDLVSGLLEVGVFKFKTMMKQICLPILWEYLVNIISNVLHNFQLNRLLKSWNFIFIA